MISLVDIKKAVIGKLKSKYPTHKVYAEQIEQGLQNPCFFVEIIPIALTNFKGYKSKNVMVSITYYSDDEEAKIESNLKMFDELSELFGLSLGVNDRVFTVQQVSLDTTDELLKYSFDVQFNEAIEIQETETKMQEIINKEVFN